MHQPSGDQAGKKRRADRLRRNLGKALNHCDQHGRAQRQQQQPEDGVVEFHENAAALSIAQRYFARPTAFIVAPRSVSDFAMKWPKSSGPA